MQPWAGYLFQYSVGGLVFFLGFFWVMVSGDASLRSREERKYLLILLLGFFGYALAHGLWTYLALHL